MLVNKELGRNDLYYLFKIGDLICLISLKENLPFV